MRAGVRRLPRRALAGLLLVLLLLVLAGLWELSRARSFQLFGELVHRVDTELPLVALTFDDGPSARYTGEILDLLRARDVQSTFFLTGSEAGRHPDETRRILAEGHELGNHSWSHRRMWFMSPARIREEVERSDAVLRAAGQQEPILFRPPYGKKLFGLPLHLARTGRLSVTWDVEPESWPDVAADHRLIAQHVLERVRPGSIVLLHVMYAAREQSRLALPLIIDGLRERGYAFRTVSQLLAEADES